MTVNRQQQNPNWHLQATQLVWAMYKAPTLEERLEIRDKQKEISLTCVI